MIQLTLYLKAVNRNAVVKEHQNLLSKRFLTSVELKQSLKIC